MQVRVWTFWLPKAGNHPDEYEDAFYPLQDGYYTGEHLRFAVADGASEGMLSEVWARLLVKAFVRHGSSAAETWLERSFRSWASWQRHYLSARAARKRPLQWFEEPGWRAGAFASLVGLTLSPGAWRATAVGDSCLFLVRQNRVHRAFPLTSSSQFGGRPGLLSSRSESNRGLDTLDAGGHVQVGDRFYLMTDALACYFLGAMERGEAPGDETALLEQDFLRRIQTLRANALLKNDDVTMVGIEILQECDQR
ncbi:MAG: protein phosphatase 2C domain-containing protein [Bacillota bacterium]